MDRAQRRRETIAATLTAAGLCTGVWLIDHSSGPQAPPQPAATQAARPGAAAPVPEVAPLPSAPPVRVRIPAIGVDAPVTGLGLEADGSLETPPEDEPDLTGWYERGTAPGAAGTAIFAGHVDHADGPSVFYGLGALRKGDTVEVDRADGRTAVFTTDSVEVHDRRDFPDERVYGRSDRAEIRLITCGGAFAESEGYLGNVVVYGHLTGSATTGPGA